MEPQVDISRARYADGSHSGDPDYDVRETDSELEQASTSSASDDDSNAATDPLSSGRIVGVGQLLSGATKKAVNKGRWSKEEDQRLKVLVREHSEQWDRIARCFADRSDVQCQKRWTKVTNLDLVKGPWSEEEDENLIELVTRYGPKKWTIIARHLKSRNSKQCRERWHNHLNPNIKNWAWAEDEDDIIFRDHKSWGNQLTKIAQSLPGSSDLESDMDDLLQCNTAENESFAGSGAATRHSHVASKGRRRRTSYTSQQVLRLEREFHAKKYLSLTERSQIASVLRLSEFQVKVWFKNRRAKGKYVKGSTGAPLQDVDWRQH